MALNIAESGRRMDILAKIIAKRLDVDTYIVEMGAAPAYMTKARSGFTEKDKIYISRRHFDEMFKAIPGADKCIKGGLFHEIGHAMYTDYIDRSTVRALVKDDAEADMLFFITNALEDIRVEDRIAKVYGGIGAELKRFMTKISDAIDLTKEQPFMALVKMIYAGARYPDMAQKKMAQLKTAGLVEYYNVLKRYGVAAREAENTNAVMLLAVKLLQELKALSLIKPPPPFGSDSAKGRKSSEKSDSGEAGSDAGGSEAADKSEEAEGGSGAGKKKSESKVSEDESDRSADKGAAKDVSGSEGEGDLSGDEDGGSSVAGDEPSGSDSLGVSKPSYEDMKKGITSYGLGEAPLETEKAKREAVDLGSATDWLIEKILAASREEFAKKGIEGVSHPKLPVKLEIDLTDCYTVHPQCKDIEKKWLPKCSYGSTSEATATVNTMCRKLKDAFIASRMSKYMSDQSSGLRITTRDLYKLTTGNVNLFSKRLDKADKDVTVTLLIDLSGSMCGKMRCARESLMVISKVLSSLGVPFEILGFSSEGYAKGGTAVPEGISYEELRIDNIAHYVIKDASERFSGEVKQRITTLHEELENWDGEAIVWAWKRLQKAKAKNKLLIVLSDGLPAGARSYRGNTIFTKRVIKRIEEEKSVKIIGVGIQTRHVKHFYKDSVVVNDVNELSGELVTLLRKQLKTESARC